MKRSPLIITALGVVMLAAFVFAACEDEPTQAEANERFCDSVGDLVAAFRNLEDLDRNSTIEEVQDERDQVVESWDAMIDAAAGVASVRLDELNDAWDDLQAAIDDVSDEATLGEALDSVDDEIANVTSELSQVLNDVDCGGESGGDSQSDE
jgi:sirohydrochlorin ferrochelatase